MAQEVHHKASYQALLNCFLGRGSRPQQLDNTLVLVSVATLRGWYLPEKGSVWLESDVLDKLGKLCLAPKQQAVLDNRVWADQWLFPKDQASQPHNNMLRR